MLVNNKETYLHSFPFGDDRSTKNGNKAVLSNSKQNLLRGTEKFTLRLMEHSLISGAKSLKSITMLGLPTLLPKKSYPLDPLLKISSRLFSLLLINHKIPTIIKEKSTL